MVGKPVMIWPKFLEITGHWFRKAEVQAEFCQGLKLGYGWEFDTGVEVKVVAALHCFHGKWLKVRGSGSWLSIGGKAKAWTRGQTLNRVALRLGQGQFRDMALIQIHRLCRDHSMDHYKICFKEWWLTAKRPCCLRAEWPPGFRQACGGLLRAGKPREKQIRAGWLINHSRCGGSPQGRPLVKPRTGLLENTGKLCGEAGSNMLTHSHPTRHTHIHTQVYNCIVMDLIVKHSHTHTHKFHSGSSSWILQ